MTKKIIKEGELLKMPDSVNDFTQYILKSHPSVPALPLTYITDSDDFINIIKADNQLKPNRCPILKEDLLYLFYGRPMYRVESDIEDAFFQMLYPVCILLKPECLKNAKRIYPFDSSAYTLHESYFPKDIYDSSIENFLIDPNSSEQIPIVEIPQRIVSTFFGNNFNYYYNKVKQNLLRYKSYAEIKSYYTAIKADRKSIFEDRLSTIEIQTDSPITLSKDTVLAVALPQVLLDEKIISETIVQKWGIEPLTYEIYHSGPDYFISITMELVGNFLREKGLLNAK